MYLHTDGTNDANFVSVSGPKILWEVVVVRVPIVVFRLAALRYHSLCRQIYDVCETSVGATKVTR